jgi:hypothetical protein
MHSPKISYLDVINRILRYLKSTPEKRFWMRRNYTNVKCGYSDADWAESFDRKSTTGLCTFVGDNLVTWKSKKACSSEKAEYRIMASNANELIWIK